LGLRVIDVETGDALINFHPRHKFLIGSVRKVFTVGELLNEIGPNHTFNTPVYRQGSISDAGILHGELILVASGDLTMGAVPTRTALSPSVTSITTKRIPSAMLNSPDPIP
jgi:D-alanyl-D-alanine carboxypeptidase